MRRGRLMERTRDEAFVMRTAIAFNRNEVLVVTAMLLDADENGRF